LETGRQKQEFKGNKVWEGQRRAWGVRVFQENNMWQEQEPEATETKYER